MNYFRIHEAVIFAAKVHDGQTRKSEPIPFVTHPYTAALYTQSAIHQERFNDTEKEDIIIATLLHDVWEDTDISLEEIGEEFGENVKELVEGASEADKSKSWLERKNATISKLSQASLALKYVIMADKLHNVVSLLEAKNKLGEKVWENFKGKKDQQEWYYRSMYEGLVKGLNPVPPVFHELKINIDLLFEKY